MSHPRQQLTLSFLPKLLVNFCHTIVENYAKTRGYSTLVAHLWHSDTNALIALHKDLFVFLRNAVLLWKIRILCFAVAVALLIISFVVSWWAFIALVPLFAIIRHLTKRMNSYYTLIAALMLALEIAGNDFGGWVSELPDVRSTASDRLRRYISESQTRFLDFYMPNCAEVSGPELIEFAGAIKTDFDLGQAEHIRKVEAIFEKS